MIYTGIHYKIKQITTDNISANRHTQLLSIRSMRNHVQTQSYGNSVESLFANTFAMCSIRYTIFRTANYDIWLTRTTTYSLGITCTTFCIHICYIIFWSINNCKSYCIKNVIMIILMMIYDDTNLYIFHPVSVNLISCDVKGITCKWKNKNHITMYANVIDNSYLHIFFLKQL